MLVTKDNGPRKNEPDKERKEKKAKNKHDQRCEHFISYPGCSKKNIKSNQRNSILGHNITIFEQYF